VVSRVVTLIVDTGAFRLHNDLCDLTLFWRLKLLKSRYRLVSLTGSRGSTLDGDYTISSMPFNNRQHDRYLLIHNNIYSKSESYQRPSVQPV